MMSFDKSKPGWLYIIENTKQRSRKFGITNSIESRLAAHGKDWEVVLLRYHHSGLVLSIMESQVKAFVLGRVQLGSVQADDMKHSGHTETFTISRRMSMRKLRKYISALFDYFSHK